MAETILTWLSTYGYLALFGILALGILGLPLPDEVLLASAGMLVSQGKLELVRVLLAAVLGSWCGITVSYILGYTVGNLALEKIVKHEHIFHISSDKVAKVRRKFDRIGGWILMFGYFLPTIRHVMGVVAGTMSLRYRVFALFAYMGALVWSATFVSLGYTFGVKWFKMSSQVRNDLLIASGGVALLLVLLYVGSRLCYGRRQR